IYTNGEEQVTFEQGKVYITEGGVFRLFDLEFLAGSADKFNEPQKAILTYSASLKYFDDPQKAIGSSFSLSGNNGVHEYELIGVLKDLPDNTHLDFELLLSFPSLDNYTKARNSWGYNSMTSYLLLDDATRTPEVVGTITE